MIGSRENHSSFSMGNKFFVIGGFSNVDAEVFNSTSRKFTSLNLKRPCRKLCSCDCETVSFCRKMYVFCSCYLKSQPKIHVYDVDEKRWVAKTVKSVKFKIPTNQKVPKQ